MQPSSESRSNAWEKCLPGGGGDGIAGGGDAVAGGGDAVEPGGGGLTVELAAPEHKISMTALSIT